MKNTVPVWKPVLLALVLLMLFVSTGALIGAAASEGATYYVFGVLNLLVYAAGIYFLYKFLFSNPCSIELNDDETTALYTALKRFNQVRGLQNKTFTTEVESGDAKVKVVADKEAGSVSIKLRG